jgi:endonuclease/exonuclease/phosphatase family metal-dependent hydrolase
MRISIALVGALLLALLGPSVAEAARKSDKPPAITVMSRNIYIGADIIRLGTAATPAEEGQSAAQLLQILQQTDFPARAKGLAAEVSKVKPDVIGIQESARISKTPDGVSDGPGGTPATEVVQDFVSVLQSALRDAGQRYRVVAVQNELDAEVATSLGYDVRARQGDAILVRTGKGAKVKVRKALKGNFNAAFSVQLADGQTITVKRGWEAMDAISGGVKFRVVNTHLEGYSSTVGEAQARELTGRGGPAGPQRQGVILTGDMNSDPQAPDPTARLPYEAIASAGFVNVLPRRLTCCQSETVNEPTPAFTSDIDFIFTLPRTKVLKTGIVGNSPSDRTPSGLWPSDHAGAWAKLDVPERVASSR